MKSWNEIRKAATAFSKRWKNAYDEKSQAQSFLKEFFAVFGVDAVTVATFEHRVKFADGSQGYADCFWQGKILAEKLVGGKFWVIQESLKGTEYVDISPDGWGMNCEGGWGYNPHYATNSWYVTWPNRRMTDRFRKAISKLTDDDIKRHPVFRPFDENWLFTTNTVSPGLVEPVRSRILADGIPATSFAAGANPLPDNVVLANLNYATFMPVDWPRRDRSWRHSDIKKVTFCFTQGFFKRIVEGDNR